MKWNSFSDVDHDRGGVVARHRQRRMWQHESWFPVSRKNQTPLTCHFSKVVGAVAKATARSAWWNIIRLWEPWILTGLEGVRVELGWRQCLVWFYCWGWCGDLSVGQPDSTSSTLTPCWLQAQPNLSPVFWRGFLHVFPLWFCHFIRLAGVWVLWAQKLLGLVGSLNRTRCGLWSRVKRS